VLLAGMSARSLILGFRKRGRFDARVRAEFRSPDHELRIDPLSGSLPREVRKLLQHLLLSVAKDRYGKAMEIPECPQEMQAL
jgi:hypothetical protein